MTDTRPVLDFSPLFACQNCRHMSVPKSWPRGNSAICAELKRHRLDPRITLPGACEVDLRLWEKTETERRVKEFIERWRMA